MLLDAGFPARRAQGRAHPRAYREPRGAPARGADEAHRLRPLACRPPLAIDYDGAVPEGFVAGKKNEGTAIVLKGVRIVEQGTFITGPCAGMMLADLGADVIKVESPDGDPYRAYQGGNYSPHFQAYNRNKRSLALDMKQPADRALFDTLIREADVFIQNFRPGTADRLGAGAQRLQELNPKLVYCSISGFGASGPYVDRPSYDSVAQALSGFLSVVVDPERPRFLGPALADAITGIYAAYGVLGALFERSRTGRGRVVEVSMLEAMAHFAVEPSLRISRSAPCRARDRPRLAQAHILRTATAGSSPSICRRWRSSGPDSSLRSMRRNWPADPRFATRLARIDNYDALGAELDALLLASARCRMGGAAGRGRRALRAHQQRGRGGEGSAGRSTWASWCPSRIRMPQDRWCARRCSSTASAPHGVRRAPLLNEHGAAIRSQLAKIRRLARHLRRLSSDIRGRPDAISHHTRRQLSAAGMAHRPQETRRTLPAARARARAVAGAGGYLEEALDDATILAIRAQEAAGLDIVTDGEIRRESYSNRFATALEGVDLDNPGIALDRSGHANPVPRVAGKIRRKHAVEVDDVKFLRANTQRRDQDHRARPVHDGAAGADRLLRRQPRAGLAGLRARGERGDPRPLRRRRRRRADRRALHAGAARRRRASTALPR